MKDCSEYLFILIFNPFFNEVNNQFSIHIRTLQSDNARVAEYSISHLKMSHGVLHQTCCPHTPTE